MMTFVWVFLFMLIPVWIPVFTASIGFIHDWLRSGLPVRRADADLSWLVARQPRSRSPRRGQGDQRSAVTVTRKTRPARS